MRVGEFQSDTAVGSEGTISGNNALGDTVDTCLTAVEIWIVHHDHGNDQAFNRFLFTQRRMCVRGQQ